jgi:hypothetical protein
LRATLIGIWLIFISSSLSCRSKADDKLVSFGKNTLYKSDIHALLGKSDFSDEERDEVISSWINTQFAATFWDSLPRDIQHRIELKTNDYRSEMILFEWENAWIERRLDTVVKESEMRQYYKDNINDFLLNEYIVKLLYIKVPDMAPDTDMLRQWYLLKKPTDTAKITQYANQYATSFYMNRHNWISFEDFVKELPIEYIDIERFVTNKSKQIFEENGYLYFVNIFDFRLKNTPSPFNYEKERIRSRILINRKLELRNAAKELFQQNLKQNDEIKFHIP